MWWSLACRLRLGLMHRRSLGSRCRVVTTQRSYTCAKSFSHGLQPCETQSNMTEIKNEHPLDLKFFTMAWPAHINPSISGPRTHQNRIRERSGAGTRRYVDTEAVSGSPKPRRRCIFEEIFDHGGFHDIIPLGKNLHGVLRHGPKRRYPFDNRGS